jgi:hypothetical protein
VKARNLRIENPNAELYESRMRYRNGGDNLTTKRSMIRFDGIDID